MLLPFYRTYHFYGGFVGIIEQSVPDFKITDGILECENKSGVDASGNIYYSIDTGVTSADTSKAEGYTAAVLVDADSITFIENGTVTDYTYADLNIANISKADILKFYADRSNRLAILFVIAAFAYLLQLVVLLIFLLWLICLTMLVNNLYFRLPLRLSHITKLCIFSMTFPNILKAVLTVIRFYLPGIIYFGLIAAYIYLGIKNCKNSDIFNDNKIPDDGVVIAELK